MATPHPIVRFPEPPTVLDLTRADASMETPSPWWIGRYDEDRQAIYTTPLFTRDRRTIHLGIDLGGPVGTPVYAFADGTVHAAGYNPAPGDYGCTLVIRHVVAGETFWMLLGHLSRESLAAHQAGQAVHRGQIIGWLGNEADNGGWPPHVHVQVSTRPPTTHDMPGVCTRAQRPEALLAYPDPQRLIGRLYR